MMGCRREHPTRVDWLIAELQKPNLSRIGRSRLWRAKTYIQDDVLLVLFRTAWVMGSIAVLCTLALLGGAIVLALTALAIFVQKHFWKDWAIALEQAELLLGYREYHDIPYPSGKRSTGCALNKDLEKGKLARAWVLAGGQTLAINSQGLTPLQMTAEADLINPVVNLSLLVQIGPYLQDNHGDRLAEINLCQIRPWSVSNARRFALRSFNFMPAENMTQEMLQTRSDMVEEARQYNGILGTMMQETLQKEIMEFLNANAGTVETALHLCNRLKETLAANWILGRDPQVLVKSNNWCQG